MWLIFIESTFNFNEFKAIFANNVDKTEALNFLWKNFDSKGFSIYFIKYQKYKTEGTNLIHTNNLMEGRIQRLDKEGFRKHSFGIHGVFGDEPNLDILGTLIQIMF